MAVERSCSVAARRAPAWTVPELVVVAAALLWLTAWAWRGGVEAGARQRLQMASQRVVGGLEEARAAAIRAGEPCGMRLSPEGWQPPLSPELRTCFGVTRNLGTGLEVGRSELELRHNFPDPVRFTANGLVLDGGTVWLRSPDTALVRCVVVSLPLGITRVGQEGPSGCEPERVP